MWTSEKKSSQSMTEPSTTSFFAPGFRMNGDIDSNNDVRVEGIIQGNLTTTKRIIIGKTGQVIGTIGSSGRVSGAHLHWELWVGGVQVNPMQWVRQSFR